MSIEVKVPVLPESVADASVATWYKKVGEFTKRDDKLVDIETDKVVLEVVAPEDGELEAILKNTGEVVKAEEVIGKFKATKEGSGAAEEKKVSSDKIEKPAETKQVTAEKADKPISRPAPKKEETRKSVTQPESSSLLSPALRRLLSENDLTTEDIRGTGENGEVTKEDILAAIETKTSKPGSVLQKSQPQESSSATERKEKRVPMTRLRARIAERLIQAQQQAAILTTFNEINMEPVIHLRKKYKESFEKTYGVRLGFMSFFTMAVVEALKQFPIINASVDGNDIVYHGYFDIGIAVSSPRGLVVPILKNAETLSMADIERQIAGFAEKAEKGQLSLEDITGGTFTISNGGVFGSLMSTPILNPPQSGILGMHKIEERPVVEEGKIVIKPMMYVALSYDHRIIDGADSVRFLVAVKEYLEEPARLALGI